MSKLPLRQARSALLASVLLPLKPLLNPCITQRVLGFGTTCASVGRPQVSRRQFAIMTPIERIADKLEKPALDDRSYRVIRLPNKLEALLVHDPETDKASASVNVNVGSFSDADDMPGMAHAVEHLLFMGTEKVFLLLTLRPFYTRLTFEVSG